MKHITVTSMLLLLYKAGARVQTEQAAADHLPCSLKTRTTVQMLPSLSTICSAAATILGLDLLALGLHATVLEVMRPRPVVPRSSGEAPRLTPTPILDAAFG